jgi:acyl-CoA thioesterase I
MGTQPRSYTDAERRQFVRYTHTRRWPMLARFPVGDALHEELLDQMLAAPAEIGRGLVAEMAEQTRATAAEMLTGRAYREALRALPFRPGDRIVAVGDSVTADRRGWFELLSASAALAGEPASEMINLGVSGNTTADVLERFDLLESARPSRVLLMLGTNDARAHGRTVSHRMVTAAETERNIRVLVDLITGELGAEVTVITPPAVDQRRIDTFFAGSPVRWQAADIAEVAQVVRKAVPDALDLHTRTGTGDDVLEADGVHPTPAGQRLILTHIVDHLVRGTTESAGAFTGS